MKILIFEDDRYDLLFPLSMMRPVFEIKPGAMTVLEKNIRALGKKAGSVSLHCRTSVSRLAEGRTEFKVNDSSSGYGIFLNGRVVFTRGLLKMIASEAKETSSSKMYCRGESVIYAVSAGETRVESSNSQGTITRSDFEKAGFSLEAAPEEAFSELCYPWDVISVFLREGLEEDLKHHKQGDKAKDRKNFINSGGIRISPKANISHAAVLDAGDGRIVIEQGAEIEPFVFIKGPAYIGKDVLVKSGAKIYGPCVIGEGSKVAGEIAESVFHSFVNKQHEGFVGHSYICPFVNLGADTVTSDLKNNYSNIRQKFRGGDIDTGMRFLGSIIGDHSKTSINTMLNTGTIAGIFANIFGGGFPKKEIGSFAWYDTSASPVKYDFRKAIETAGIVMARRGIKITAEYVELASEYYDMEL